MFEFIVHPYQGENAIVNQARLARMEMWRERESERVREGEEGEVSPEQSTRVYFLFVCAEYSFLCYLSSKKRKRKKDYI